jgi:hypothetical protein
MIRHYAMMPLRHFDGFRHIDDTPLPLRQILPVFITPCHFIDTPPLADSDTPLITP